MTFPILGGNGAVGGYTIDNSLRVNSDDQPYLAITPSSASNRRTMTFSCWAKRSKTGGTYGAYNSLFSAESSGNEAINIAFGNGSFSGAGDYLEVTHGSSAGGGSYDWSYRGTGVYRDKSAWYHIVASIDTTQSTASDRIKLYINGIEIAKTLTNSVSQNTDLEFNNTYQHLIGAFARDDNSHYDGYLAETHFIDGQALSPTDFGEFDESGIWKPIQYTGSYGTNGFYLDFENSGSLGTDASPNGNNFTPTNLASTDQTTDTPTNNFATFDVLNKAPSLTISEGNTYVVTPATGANNFMVSSNFRIPKNSGKWFWETKITSSFIRYGTGIAQIEGQLGLGGSDANSDTVNLDTSPRIWLVTHGGTVEGAGTSTSAFSGCAVTQNDIATFMYDSDAGEIYYAVNGTIGNSGSALVTGITGDVVPIHRAYGTTVGSQITTWYLNHGNPAYSLSSAVNDANGYGNFEHAPLSGYKSLCTQNLATALSPTIDDGSAYFQVATWSGNGSTQAITNNGNSNLQPDFLWIKARNEISDHALLDSTRGLTKRLFSNLTDAETNDTNATVSSFDSDGFTMTQYNVANDSDDTGVGWQWKANGGTTSSNTDGSITSTVQANTTAGFSIVTYTGTGSNATVGHGLGVAPKVVILKRRDGAGWSWYTQHINHYYGNGSIYLNGTGIGDIDSTHWNNTAPSSSVFSVGTSNGTNGSSGNFVSYCFAEIEGYSKFGSYTGNGSTDGTFVYTGFRPAFVIVKTTSRTGDWIMEDTSRSTYNPVDDYLRANGNNAEVVGTSSAIIDFLSNGFKCRANGFVINESSASYIYYAVAENPFCTSTGIPVTAR